MVVIKLQTLSAIDFCIIRCLVWFLYGFLDMLHGVAGRRGRAMPYLLFLALHPAGRLLAYRYQ